jgi:glycine cleavage system H protein
MSMTTINGCNLPDDLYYMIDKHVWAKEIEGGNVRVGMTAVAVKLAGGKFIAVTPKRKAVGQELAQGKSMATVESSKFVGPVPAPVSGVVVKVNDAVADDPGLAVSDPYGEGWVAELQPTNWEADKGSLAHGEEGLAAYKSKLEADDVHCDA